MLQKYDEQLKWQLLNANPIPQPEKFTGAQVDLEISKTEKGRT